MRSTLVYVVLLTTGLAVSVPASAAPFEDVGFTALFSDAADLAGFLDIREVAVGEPGDQTLILRFTTGTFSTAPPGSSIHLFMTTPGGAFRAGVTSAGAAVTHSSSVGGTVSECVVDGNVAYCTVAYESMKAAPGDELAGTSAVSYATVAQDYAPGALFVPDGVLGPKGSNYKLLGCSKLEAASCPAPDAGASGVTYANLETASLKQGVSEPTTGIFVYNFTTALDNATLHYEVNGTGNVTLTVHDGNQTTLFNQTFGGAAAGNQTLAGMPGNWTYTVNMTAFNGTISLDLVRPDARDATPESPSNSTTPTGNATNPGTTDAPSTTTTPDDEISVPGFGFVAAVAALGLLARRRR